MSKTIAFDIGNTNISIAVFEDSKIIFRDRIISDIKAPFEYYKGQLEKLGKQAGLGISDLKIIICSVVPVLGRIFDKLVQEIFSQVPLQVGASLCAGIKLDVQNPESLGADRIANVVAAKTFYSNPCLIIDFGTATTFDVVGLAGSFEGGIIVPGPKTSMAALLSSTAQLSEVELVWPKQLVGKTTETAMQSGLVMGYMAMVDGLIERLQTERGRLGRIVATGGLGCLFAKHSKYIELYEVDLTLMGMQVIAERVC